VGRSSRSLDSYYRNAIFVMHNKPKRKRGRPLLGARPMTDAERMARMRARRRGNPKPVGRRK
jgi:hypothetical protein